MQYNLVESSQQGTSLIVIDEPTLEVLTIPASHPNFARILELAQGEGEFAVVKRLSNADDVLRDYVGLSERVSMRGRKLYFDGDRVKGQLVKHIVRMQREGQADQAQALVNFLEKLSTNPSEVSRESLYRWLRDRDFTITEDGDFIAYKGTTHGGLSVSHGTAWVDGVQHTGGIPNEVGTTVTMPRSSVDDDTALGCSIGLHAGTFDYARHFSPARVVSVKVNPRDVVSVPADSEHQKLRVCRYTVLEVVATFYREPIYVGGHRDDEDDYDAEDDDNDSIW